MNEIKGETTFEQAVVGDRCYSPLFSCRNIGDKTNATIQNITKSNECSIRIVPDIMCDYFVPTFSFSGKYSIHGGQLLFWENPITEIPVRPKRKVIKTGFIGIKPVGGNNGLIAIAITTHIYNTDEDIPKEHGYQIKTIEFETEE